VWGKGPRLSIGPILRVFHPIIVANRSKLFTQPRATRCCGRRPCVLALAACAASRRSLRCARRALLCGRRSLQVQSLHPMSQSPSYFSRPLMNRWACLEGCMSGGTRRLQMDCTAACIDDRPEQGRPVAHPSHPQPNTSTPLNRPLWASSCASRRVVWQRFSLWPRPRLPADLRERSTLGWQRRSM